MHQDKELEEFYKDVCGTMNNNMKHFKCLIRTTNRNKIQQMTKSTVNYKKTPETLQKETRHNGDIPDILMKEVELN